MNSLTEIDVRNFKRVRRAHLLLDGNTLVITGENEQGKSSFIDAIAALFGGKDKSPGTPVRKGAKEAVVIGRLKTSDGRTLKATLTFGLPNSRRIVVVDDESGKPVSSPQAMLDSFWAEASFDPSLFLASDEKSQLAMLMKMAGLDFSTQDQDYKLRFDERTIVNRDVERLRAQLAGQPSFPDAPEAEVTSASILSQIDTADRHNKECDTLDQTVRVRDEDLASANEDVTATTNRIVELKKQLADAEKELKENQQIAQGAKKSLDEGIAARDAKKRIDDAPFRAQLSQAEETNRKVRANATRAKTAADLKAKTAEAEKLTTRLEKIAEDKEETIRTAKFPVDGLSLSETGVIFEGLPLDQASDSRKIAIGVEMAAAMNPNKPLMLVRHGNLFTAKNFSILQQVAEKRNLTVIVEIAGDKRADSKLHFVDGLAGDEAEPEAPAEESTPAPVVKAAAPIQPNLDLPPST